MRTRVYYGEALGRYGFGHGHPFGSDRLNAFWHEMVRQGLDLEVEIVAPVLAKDSDLLAFHTPEYVERVKRASMSGDGYLDEGDTPAFPGVYEAACFVVGSTCDAVARVTKEGGRAFVPIGGLHHSRRNGAAGFCVFNDVGVAIEKLRNNFGVRRVAYVDIDAHHGDGVFYAFDDDPDLILADLHEDGHYLYPGTGFAYETGAGAAKDTKLNVPMPPGADDAAVHAVWPRVEAFVRAGRPEIVLLQAGADSIADDPITHLRYTPAVHGFVASRLCALADELCEGRVVAMGGGGYNRDNLARAWNEVVKALLADS